MEIGKRIKAHRAAAGMSQDELARRVYVSRQTISSWENDWTLAQTLPTIMFAFVLWGIAMAGSVWAERIKKEHDLATYQEVLAFMSSKAVDRNTERGRRERLIPRWMKTIRTIGFILISMAVGAFLGWNLAALVDNLLS